MQIWAGETPHHSAGSGGSGTLRQPYQCSHCFQDFCSRGARSRHKRRCPYLVSDLAGQARVRYGEGRPASPRPLRNPAAPAIDPVTVIHPMSAGPARWTCPECSIPSDNLFQLAAHRRFIHGAHQPAAVTGVTLELLAAPGHRREPWVITVHDDEPDVDPECIIEEDSSDVEVLSSFGVAASLGDSVPRREPAGGIAGSVDKLEDTAPVDCWILDDFEDDAKNDVSGVSGDPEGLPPTKDQLGLASHGSREQAGALLECKQAGRLECLETGEPERQQERQPGEPESLQSEELAGEKFGELDCLETGKSERQQEGEQSGESEHQQEGGQSVEPENLQSEKQARELESQQSGELGCLETGESEHQQEGGQSGQPDSLQAVEQTGELKDQQVREQSGHSECRQVGEEEGQHNGDPESLEAADMRREANHRSLDKEQVDPQAGQFGGQRQDLQEGENAIVTDQPKQLGGAEEESRPIGTSEVEPAANVQAEGSDTACEEGSLQCHLGASGPEILAAAEHQVEEAL